VAGAIIFIAIDECFRTYLGFTESNIVATGLLMVLVLLFFPQGIVGTLNERGKLPQILDWD
jgi:branched-chain amino acid transport system permease protein